MNAPLDSFDIDHCVARLPRVVRDVMEREGSKIFLAGGYIRARIRGERVNDVDLFCRDAADAERVIREIQPDADRVHETDNAFTTWCRGYAIQTIHRWTFESPAACIDSFDFSIARAVIWFETKWSGVCHPRFYQDLAARRLVYLDPVGNDAGGSFLRVMKFVRRGYSASPETLALMIARTLRPNETAAEKPDPLADEDQHDDLAVEHDLTDERVAEIARVAEDHDLQDDPVDPDDIEATLARRFREVDPRIRRPT